MALIRNIQFRCWICTFWWLSAACAAGQQLTPIAPGDMPVTIGQMAEIEQLALAVNPAIQNVQAQMDALRGKRLQAGLRPNPVVGTAGGDIFANGQAGRYGVFYSQQVVRGNKLGLAQQVVDAELATAEEQLRVLQRRLQTDVRYRYFDAILAQRRVKVTAELVAMLERGVETSQALVDAKEVAQTAVLQSEIELEKATVLLRQAENDRVASFAQLAALINEPELPFESLDGDPEQIVELPPIEEMFDRLLESSPEISAGLAQVDQARQVLQRACAEPIPNVTWETSLSYDSPSDNIVSSFLVGLPLPTTNRNQGATQEARHTIVAMQRSVEKTVLKLRQQLIAAYQSFNEARIQLDAYTESILPKSKQSLELITAGYQQGETGFLAVLTAQRTYIETQLQFLARLQQVGRQAILIDGQLLSGSLD